MTKLCSCLIHPSGAHNKINSVSYWKETKLLNSVIIFLPKNDLRNKPEKYVPHLFLSAPLPHTCTHRDSPQSVLLQRAPCAERNTNGIIIRRQCLFLVLAARTGNMLRKVWERLLSDCFENSLLSVDWLCPDRCYQKKPRKGNFILACSWEHRARKLNLYRRSIHKN